MENLSISLELFHAYGRTDRTDFTGLETLLNRTVTF
jgi:hypothetical protein